MRGSDCAREGPAAEGPGRTVARPADGLCYPRSGAADCARTGWGESDACVDGGLVRRPAVDGGCGADLPVATDPADRAVSARRHHRPVDAAGGRRTARQAQSAGHRREQARRQRHDRPARDAQGGARRLHACRWHRRQRGDRLRDGGEPAVRCVARLRPDRRHRRIRHRHGGQHQDAGEVGRRVRRLRQGATRQAHIRLDRHRRARLSGG